MREPFSRINYCVVAKIIVVHKRIKQGFGWAKMIGSIRQVMVRGLQKVDQLFVLNMVAYNLTRMRTLGQVRLQGASGV